MSVQLATPACALHTSDRHQDYSLAIVGGGPRGLFCLESLARSIGDQSISRPLRVTIYEPAPTLGAGNVYEPTQPHYLRMNFAAKHINAWSPDGRPDASRPSLIQWLVDRYPSLADPDATLPRAIVGEYLRDCFNQVARSLPPRMSLQIHRSRVQHLRRRGSQWELTTVGGLSRRFDEVMLTVGHQGWRDKAARIYPVTTQLTAERVPAGATVSIRGFALTWIDATLALTEGRGGSFDRTPLGYEYTRCGTEPANIVPHSRSFRPMLAKPDESQLSWLKECQPIWRHHRGLLASLQKPQSGFDFLTTLWPIVMRAAMEALQKIDASGDVEGWIYNWVSGPMSAAQAESQMRASHAVATGNHPPGPAWAIGEAWRQLYAAMVEQISHGGLAIDSWRAFASVSREMERIAFGPPADNLGRILALIDAGIVDLSGKYSDTKNTVHLDAVIAAPADLPTDSPVEGLLHNGVIHRIAGGGGIEVDRCGRPIASDGRVIDRLAILGRATEGCIVGNDTLSRTLHPHPKRWAESVVRSLSFSRHHHA